MVKNYLVPCTRSMKYTLDYLDAGSLQLFIHLFNQSTDEEERKYDVFITFQCYKIPSKTAVDNIEREYDENL